MAFFKEGEGGEEEGEASEGDVPDGEEFLVGVLIETVPTAEVATVV